MIINAFLFDSEFDLLELRMRELGDIVDRFILLEHDVSMRGKRKPFYFQRQAGDWKDRYPKLESHQVMAEEYGDDPRLNFNWECKQREHFSYFVTPKSNIQNVQDDDTILLDDADEIADPECVKSYFNGMGAYRFISHFSNYYMNLRRPDNVLHSSRQIIGPATMFLKLGFSFMRFVYPAGNNVFVNKGWHFSCLGGYDALVRKIASAAEGHGSDWIKNERPIVEQRMNDGMNFDGSSKFQFVPIDGTFPKTVRENVDQYAKLGYFKL